MKHFKPLMILAGLAWLCLVLPGDVFAVSSKAHRNKLTRLSATPPPGAFFTPGPRSGCAPLLVDFFNASLPGTYLWDFDDPASGTLNNSAACSPSHIFNTPGDYLVTLQVTYGATTYTHVDTVHVLPKPAPQIIGDTDICIYENFKYHTAYVPGHFYTWQVLGGSYSLNPTRDSITITWTTTGIGRIIVGQNGGNGCIGYDTLLVDIHPIPTPNLDCGRKRGSATGGSPPHELKEDTTCVCGNGIEIITMPHNGNTYVWTITNGTIVYSSALADTIHVLWNNSGMAYIKVVEISPWGCKDSTECLRKICPGPLANFTSTIACSNNPTDFNATSSVGNTTITAYHWDFGDLSTSSAGPLTTHNYLGAGPYNVTLTVTNENGCKDDTTKQVTINPGIGPPIFCPAVVCAFGQAAYTTPYYPGVTYSWVVNGHFIHSTGGLAGDSLYVTWGAGPVGTVTLNVTGGLYTCGTTTVNIPIFPAHPVISGPVVACQNELETYSAPLIPGTIYTWSVSGGIPFVPANNSNSAITLNPGFVGSFTITLHMKNELVCCEADTFLNVITKPKFAVFGLSTVCENQTATYSVTGGTADWVVAGGVFIGPFTGVASVTVKWGPGPVGTLIATTNTTGVFCNTTFQYTVTINPAPPAANISGQDIVCENTTWPYSVPASPGISYLWSVTGLGAGGSISGATTNVLTVTWGLAVPVTGVIQLQQTNTTTGCSSITTFNVQKVPAALPAITGPSIACVNDIQTFTIPSNPGGIYAWNVSGGNILSGTTGTSLIVQWGYASPGKVILTNNICNTLTSVLITIMDTPTIDVDTVLHCPSASTVGLIAHSCSTCTYLWEEISPSPGIISTTNTATITVAGLYKLTVTNSAGCQNTRLFNFTGGLPAYPAPNATIIRTVMANNPFCPNMYKLMGANPPSGSTYTYQWTQGANTYGTQSVYDSVAGHVYHLVVTNQFGCTDDAYDTIPTSTCIPLPPDTGSTPCPHANPNFTVNTCDSVHFTNTTTGGGGPYYWTFGDTTFSYDTNPYHSYQHLGTFPVTLWAYMAGGCVHDTTINVTINTILRARFTDSVITCNPLLVNFYTASATALSTGAITYSWNFGDFTFGTGANPSHTYTTPGTYIVTLSIISLTCTSTVSHTIYVKPFDAAFTSCGLCTGQPVQFTDLSVSGNPIVNWQWDFGDGNFSTLQNPWHPFGAPGPYSVKLVITDSRGCKDSIIQIINITTFTAGSITVVGSTTFCEGGFVILKAPVGAGWTYLWSDGTTTVNDTITQNGDYSVIVIDITGCKDTLGVIHVTVNPKPYATITGPTSTCQGTTIRLDGPIGAGYTYQWYHNGIPYATSQSIFLSNPADAGNYTLVVNNGMCTDSTLLPTVITILPAPAPVIAVAPGGYVCEGNIMTLTASATGATGYLWSTGATTAAIGIYSSGTYTVTAFFANGCQSSTSYTAAIQPLPDLSIIPTGCYTICEGQTVRVPGPTPMPGQSFSYRWYNGMVLVGTSYILNISAPGSYWVIVKNNITGCVDTSDQFSVTVVAPPVASIVPITSPVLCIGTGGTVVLSAGPVSGPYTFAWYNTLYTYPIGTGPTITVTTAGTYVLEVLVSNCCKSYDTIVISEINCCFPPGTTFTAIPDSFIVSTDQVWNGKYYIDGKVHVINNAVLDLTEVDLVFSRTGEIIFHDNTIIRANNSVLRPCLMRDIWVGLTFLDNSEGYIHTTLFKNATIAVNYTAADVKSVRLTDNSFVNCNTGVYISKPSQLYDEGITGNSFTVDSTDLPFPSPGSYTGIQVDNTIMNEMISQNDFRNSTQKGQTKRFYGILSVQSTATLSENTFTNMYRSIDVSTPSGPFNIENNHMEVTQSVAPNDYQIRVSISDVPFLIFHNDIRSSTNMQNAFCAIYTEDVNNMKVWQNTILGFDFGMAHFRMGSSQILENTVTDSRVVGIYTRDMRSVDIACNTIDMDQAKVNSTSVFGVACANTDEYSYIRSNCVFDCSASILLFGGSGGLLPTIKNNFLYNYEPYGINVMGYTGNIGGPSGAFFDAGRNTFTSNSNPGVSPTFDINSTLPIFEGGNYGINLLPVGLVTPLTAPNLFNSSASCGMQITNPRGTRIDEIAICGDRELHPWFEDKQHMEWPQFPEPILQLPFEDRLKATLYTMYRLPQQDRENFVQAIINAKVLIGQTENQWLQFNCQVSAGKWANALSIVNNIQPMGTNERDLKYIETLRCTLALQQNACKTLDETTKAALTEIDNRRGLYASVARDFLQLNDGKHDYIFTSPTLPTLAHDRNQKSLAIGEEFLKVYPNPATNDLTIKYYTDDVQNLSLTLTDITGRTMNNWKLNFNGAELHLDVSSFSAGMYFISLKDAKKGYTQNGQFIKQ